MDPLYQKFKMKDLMETDFLKIIAVLLSGQELELGSPVHMILCLVSHQSQTEQWYGYGKSQFITSQVRVGSWESVSWGVKMAGELTWVRTKFQKST